MSERRVDTAYELFFHRGIRATGVDELIERAGVAKATFYRHLPSKDDVVIAFLERREERWAREWIEKVAKRRGATPEQSLLAIPRRENRSSAVWTIRSSARWEASSLTSGLGTPSASV
jgi:AcrR family transcriptional regulator